VNLGSGKPGDPLHEGAAFRVILAVDGEGQVPCQQRFLGAREVRSGDKDKIRGALLQIAREGFPRRNKEAYQQMGEVHCVKWGDFRALCLERVTSHDRRELIVALIVPEWRNDAQADADLDEARRVFAAHCERFPVQ
jgi:hypothetical protein